MIMHIYMIERQTQQQTIREMIASQDYLVIDNIIINNQNNKYIKIDNNKINIDYTSLIKYFDETTENYLIDIEINENDSK